MLTTRFLVTALAGAIMVGSTVAAYAAIAPAATGRGSQLVTPKEGMLNVRPIPWRKVENRGGQTVRVFFTSGVEPCYVLNKVTVDYGADKIAITLYEGSDPVAESQTCIMVTVEKAVDVMLAEPLGNRAIVDGSAQR